MASPITWRNVEAPSNAGVAQLLNGAQNGINSGFDRIGDVLKQREQMDQANWNQQKTNNTQAFMDALGEAKTPEELQAKQAFLANMRQGMGAQIDAPAARAAEEARPGVLQQRAITNNTYDDSQRTRAEAPVVDRITQLALTDPVAAQAALAEAPVKFKAVLQKAIGDASQQKVLEGRASTEFTWKGNDEARKADDQLIQRELLPLQKQQMQASTNASNASAAVANANRTKILRELDAEGNPTKKIQTAIEAFKPTSHFSDGIAGTKEGDAAIEKAIKEAASNPAEARDIRYNLQKFMANRDPKDGPVPASAVIASIGKATPNPVEGVIPGWSRRGDDMASNLTEHLEKNRDTIMGDFNTLNELNLRLVSRGTGNRGTAQNLVPPAEPEKQAAPVKEPEKQDPVSTAKSSLKRALDLSGKTGNSEMGIAPWEQGRKKALGR